MGEPKSAIAPVDSQHYRELAEKLRNIARQCRSAGARQKILDFASRYDGRADHLDTWATAAGPAQDPG
jgi:hypothetical protein